jgi:UDP-N-acetylglucosamine:LPS N-acetylglucosamine transferase
LAVASRGGHWIQLLRLRPAFEGAVVTFVTTAREYQSMIPGQRFRVVAESNRSRKLLLVWTTLQLLWIIFRERPTTIISTGAAPGFLAIRLGRLLRIRTMWVDSIANAEELSLSGRLALKHADVVLTQWEHLAQPGVVDFQGSVV